MESVDARLNASNVKLSLTVLSAIYILSSVDSFTYIPVLSGESSPTSIENSLPSFFTTSALTLGLSSPHSAAVFSVISRVASSEAA